MPAQFGVSNSQGRQITETVTQIYFKEIDF